MSEKKKVLGFYGMVEFGDYLNSLSPGEHSFQMENPQGELIDCSRPEVLRQFQVFCGGDLDKFRLRIVITNPQTRAKRYSEKILRRTPPPRARLGNLFKGLLGRQRPSA